MNNEDPNAYLFEDEKDDRSEDQAVMDYVYGKIPNRVSAMSELWSDNLFKQIESMELPNDEAKIKTTFNLTASAALGMFTDALDPESAPEIVADLDLFIGIALTNKRYGVNLMREQHKFLQEIPREKFKDDEEYVRALSDFEDEWWDKSQPALDMRTPADAIRETLKLYGLNDR